MRHNTAAVSDNPEPLRDEIEDDSESRTLRARRTTIALYALAAALLVVGVMVRWRRSAVPVAHRYDWLVLVVMPYDNDLDRCADPIVDALSRGVQHGDQRERVAVAVLADRAGTDRLTESLITRHKTERWTLSDDDSASVANVEGFFDRMTRRAPAQRHIIVFLDHGGAVDELGVDHRPARQGSERWLSASATGAALRRWRGRARADVPLLFLQQCGRGSIEVALAFEGVSDAILASQTYVGSCNTYYEPLVDRLRERATLRAREIGATIMSNDRDYTVYSLLDSAALAQWPARSNALVAALQASAHDGHAVAPSGALRAVTPTFVAGDEESLDLLEAANRLALTRGEPAIQAANAFTQWVSSSLVIGQRQRGAAGSRAWSGVSTVVPNASAIASVRELPGWRGTRWSELTALARSER